MCRFARALAIPAALVIALGCGGGDGPVDPPRLALGGIQVAVQTVAATLEAALDPDGYTVAVEGLALRSVEANGTVTLAEVPVGDHVVVLDGMQVNCTTPVNPVEITVSEGGVSHVSFPVTCWPPTRGRIVFTADVDDTYDLWSINPDGTEPTKLTANVGVPGGLLSSSDLFPSWSPDGWKIAYFHQLVPSRNIWVMNADGSGATQITRSSNGMIRNTSPSWSPDGSKITFASDRSGDLDIYTIDADGTDLVRLTSSSEDDTYPSWTPDGSKLVFTRAAVSGETAGVFMMNPDGTEQVMLTGGENWWDWVVGRACSPDGSRIVFASSRDGNWELYVMNPDGSDQVRLTFTETRSEEPAAWSPDGTRILFTSVIEGTGETRIYTMNGDGTDRVWVTRSVGGGNHLWPDWSHASGALAVRAPKRRPPR